jgi:hypothetical protein
MADCLPSAQGTCTRCRAESARLRSRVSDVSDIRFLARAVHPVWCLVSRWRSAVASVARTRPVAIRLLLAVLLVTATTAIATAQQTSIYYVYDDLTRLSAVVSQQGDVAVYAYDAVGNILKIERFNATELPGAVGISYFAPSVGREGTVVQIFGKGFSATPGQNSLAFNGTLAVITSTAPNRLVASVPTGATTGPLSVSTPLGSATSAASFRMLGGGLAVAPAVTEVQVGLSRQFRATEGSTPTTNVRWSVNGVGGGDPSIGTMSASGLYTAPAFMPVPSTLTITATHQDDSTLTASAQVTVLAAGPLYIATRSLSVALAAPPAVVDQSVTSAVSVQFAGSATAFANTALLSVTVEPVITGVTPVSTTAGSTLSLSITGRGLARTTAVSFLRNNVTDTTITVNQITPSGDDTSVAVDIAIAGGAPLGGRVVQVTADGRASSPAATAGNVFTVQ